MHVVHSLSIGGMERALLLMIQQADPRRLKHVLCTMRQPGPLARELPTDVPVEALEIHGRDRFASVRLDEVNYELGQRAAHNSFILCWAELGIQGFALFILLVTASIVQTWQCYRRAEYTDDPAWTRYMAYGLFLSLIVSLSTQMFTERLYTESRWWLLALPGCLKRVVMRSQNMVSVSR